MLRQTLLSLVFTGMMCFWSTSSVCACACCADHGVYYRTLNPLGHYVRNELKKYKLRGFLDEDWSGTRGLVLLKGDTNYIVNGVFDGKNSFHFFIYNQKNKLLGKILFKSKQKVEEFATDHGEENKGLGVILYKEFRFDGTAYVTGEIANSIGKQLKAFLVMQGKGNFCLNSGDLNHFILKFSVKKGGEIIPLNITGSLIYSSK